MPISYKHKIYTTLGTPTSLSGEVVSATDSAGVPAKDYTVKGKMIVWNQLLDKSKYPATTTTNGVTFTNNGDGSIAVNGTATDVSDFLLFSPYADSLIPRHKYLISGSPNDASINAYIQCYDPINRQWLSDAGGGGIAIFPKVVGPNVGSFIRIRIAGGYTANNLVFKPQLFDLTQMFGEGNKPTTPAEFRAMFPDDYYPYNAGELKTIVPISIEAKNQLGETRFVNIPSSKYFPDGMRSAGSAYDEINFLSQKAIKRIGAVDMGTLNWNSNSGQYPTNSFYSNILANAKKATRNVVSNGKFYNLYVDENGHVIAFTVSTEVYNSSKDFKAAMSGVMLYYELDTPLSTAISPPLQSLPTYKGFTSFSAPNSLTQNGPLSVTYYAEGGASPEKGWLTSYKRKLYMGRNITWNQLVDKSKFQNVSSLSGISVTNTNDGSVMFNGTKTTSDAVFFSCGTYQITANHKYYLCGAPEGSGNRIYQLYSVFIPTGGASVYSFDNGNGVFFSGQATASGSGNINILISKNTVSKIVFTPQLFDLTLMFGAGNEPTTPTEFWSHFGRKYYPYNVGETQPLFTIGRKSQIKEG